MHAARKLAEHHFAQAEKAVEEYLDGIEDNDRLKEADFLELRKELLTSAVPFYEDFVKARPADAELDANGPCLRAPGVRPASVWVIGSKPCPDYRQALLIFQALWPRFRRPAYRRQQAHCHYQDWP